MEQHLIVVEGNHDKLFLEEYLRFLRIRDHFKIMATGEDSGGHSKLPVFLLKQFLENILK